MHGSITVGLDYNPILFTRRSIIDNVESSELSKYNISSRQWPVQNYFILIQIQ